MNPTKFDSVSFLKTVPHKPGIYQMFNDKNTIIYVGKAKNLNHRLKSYFNSSKKTLKTDLLVSHIARVEFTLTHTETEALLLEQTYIKKYQPRYNVLLKDDKSYPFIKITKERHPQLSLYRGSINRKTDEFYGPYPSSYAVKQILILLQKLFPIRQCPDSTYHNRTRPCLQYQIKRCLGPCVAGLVSDEDYQQQVNYVRLFLQGQSETIIETITRDMLQASADLNFEKAAKLRDQLQAIKQINEKQVIYNKNDNLDVIGFHYQLGVACVYILFIRNGQTFGHRAYYPKVPSNTELEEVIETFLGQFYLQGNNNRNIPKKILLNYSLSDRKAMEETLSLVANYQVKLVDEPKGDNLKLLNLAIENAQKEVKNKLLQSSTLKQRYDDLKTFLGIKEINRMECFDISHFMGKNTIASCVVFDDKGPVKSEFRRYNISGITEGDDYAAMNQVLTRRYNKPDLPEDKIPDVIFIDGGKGQLNQAKTLFDSLDVNWNKDHPILLGVAKGSERKEGLETLFFETHGKGHYLDVHSPALLLIQQIRNASHDHAIIGQRKKNLKQLTESTLEQIEGVGAKRRQALLKHFGGLRELKNATAGEISQVQGISKSLAEKIFEELQR
ncbi:excinuclease ABC subunit UvrC [Frischella perrara]|jgi:excinuclease ABC, C subunit|uniref:UvrABC system protein C n=1 Tax=Frischella perrara TaxID=1267021 RepID=L0APN3_FRIPE|nr:excinuclease ABC subunit UvrC [Frischella perrara]AFZ77057.1 nuclease subunit of the excinuclease complex [Frischella perrara]AJA44885.1 Excinuclease ABC subunit C [Frischella perrara]PWV59403.1 excinuclease ABC subunit C [Frischella perrara]